MAVHYDISSLDSNKTILETLHDIQKYLKANPIYKVYYANGSYAIGQAQYSISLLGNNQGQIAEGDVVFFNNNFYAKISSVGTQTFSVFPATAIQGSGGAQIKTMSQLEFLNVLSLLYDDNAGAHINMSGRTEYIDGTETPNTLEILVPFVPKDNSIKFETSENFEQVKVGLNSKVVSNPNLVINPDLSINQRGLSSYEATNGNIKYCVDRFYLWSATSISFNVSNKTITTGNSQGAFGTYFEKLNEGIYTLSIKWNGQVYTVSGNVSTTESIGKQLSHGYISLNYNSGNSKYRIEIAVEANQSIPLEWVKLEVGELATEFVPPLIAEELAKCQRYYRIERLWSYAKSTYTLYQQFIPFEMRTTPTGIIYACDSSGSRVGGEKTIYDITSGSILNLNRNPQYASKFGCVINSSGVFVQDHQYSLEVELDAEIY